MKRTNPLLPAALVSLGLNIGGCGAAIAPAQADGHDCNAGLAAGACGAASYCDPGVADATGTYARKHTYGFLGDKTHPVGTCRPRGAAGAACHTPGACASGRCVHPEPNPAIGAAGVCE